ncbi:hypothetical protein L1049_027381 [Liquidambar formosana]|uniref:Uncharacterized protein n=1 Tax=Liquidambar formosana TaxID=63359 RepID=A0AAP0WVB6_LIQFO
MVAISLYRGNLHRVPDVPRRWLMPTHRISLKDFKSLLTRRLKALSRLRSTTTAIITTDVKPNLNPNPKPSPNSKHPEEDAKDDVCSKSFVHVHVHVQPKFEPEKVYNPEEGTSKDGAAEEGTSKDGAAEEGTSKDGAAKEVKYEQGSDGDDRTVKPVDGSSPSPGSKPAVPDNAAADPVDANGGSQAVKDEKPADTENPNVETRDKVDALNEKEKRKREVEEKLEILNAKKHKLVQGLKQILNTEEELRRRTSMQGLLVRPSVPLQVDTTNDSGSMTRHVAPRMGSEANLGGDMEGGEADDVSNHNMHSRHLLRMSSTSPSSESPLRRPAYFQHNVVAHPSRASLVVAGSPSRFAPMGHQGHPSNLPTVSVTGTNYIASSPSPAASGGTSVFRDARLPSPWN